MPYSKVNKELLDRLTAIDSTLTQLGPKVTTASARDLASQLVYLTQDDATELKALGISHTGRGTCVIGVPENASSYVSFRIINEGTGTLILLGPAHSGGSNVTFRALSDGCTAVFPDPSRLPLSLLNLTLRSQNQLFFFGSQATSTGTSVEVHGANRQVVIGDNCMLSSGVWIRNYDMHTIYDVDTSEILNGEPTDTVLEQRVWVGQDSLLLRAERVGFGSIIGAKSMVKGDLPACVLAAGVPARVLRERTSWSRRPLQVEADALAAVRHLSSL